MIYFLIFSYVFFIGWRVLNQTVFAFLNKVEHDKKYLHSTFKSKTSIIYPIHNEDPEILKMVISAALKVANEDNEVIFIDDGSENLEDIIGYYKIANNNKNCKVILIENCGKRKAQYLGFDVAKNDIIITVDSDTLITKAGVENIVKYFKDEKVGCVTGDVKVYNSDVNILTKFTEMRYWSAFHLERASQSYVGAMMCASGPFSAYRKSVIDKVKDTYISQYFGGKECTFGDDRHLTNLILNEGYDAKFCPDATAYTFVPEKLTQYLNQQTRWSKSFYREVLWTIKFWRKVHPFSLLDTVIQPVIFFLFLVSLSTSFFVFINTKDISIIFYYFLSIILSGLIRVAYAIFYTKNLSFLYFVFYGFFHLFILVPYRFKALLTMLNTGWGTRSKSSAFSVYIWIAIFWVFVYLSSLLLGQILSIEAIEKNFRIFLLLSNNLNNNILIGLLPYIAITCFIFVITNIKGKTQTTKFYSLLISLLLIIFTIFYATIPSILTTYFR